jgi:hypothetical protein
MFYGPRLALDYSEKAKAIWRNARRFRRPCENSSVMQPLERSRNDNLAFLRRSIATPLCLVTLGARGRNLSAEEQLANRV